MLRYANRLRYIFISIIALLLISCQGNAISQTSQKLERYAVNTRDLPKGWAFSSEDWGSESGEHYYGAAYGLPNRDIIGLSQVIRWYQDEEKAQLGYSEYEEEWFSVGQEWPGAEFTPLGTKDNYRYVCLHIFSEILSCRFLQRHNNIVTLILVNFDDQAMTMTQFNEILKVLDKRLNTVTLD